MEEDMEFLLIISAHFLALLSPGPDFFLITRAALRLPMRYCLAICAGIATANGVYLCCAVCGLEVIREWTILFTGLRIFGAAYLIYIGILLLKAPRKTLQKTTEYQDSILDTHSNLSQFLVGFMSGILNPKNAIFYLSLFTVMVSRETALATKGMYALWMTSVVFLWDATVVYILSRGRIKSSLENGVFYVEKLAGVMLTAFGLSLPFT